MPADLYLTCPPATKECTGLCDGGIKTISGWQAWLVTTRDLDELVKPAHLDEDTWVVIQVHRDRIARAIDAGDRPAVVGASKDLVECIARVVLEVTGATMGDEAKFGATVDAAQKQLGVRPVDLGNDPAVRAIAQSAATMVKRVNELRNDVGTGHGRARMPEIADAAEQAAVDAAMLWSKWALRLLDPVMAGSAGVFIEALSGAISRSGLVKAMHAVDLATQPPDAQHSIGVAVGQRAGGGFGNAWAVGVNPAREDGGLDDWPSAYRLGLVEGFVLNWAGQIDLNEYSAKALVDVMEPVPSDEAAVFLAELGKKLSVATWAPHWRSRQNEAAAFTSSIVASSRANSNHAPALSDLAERLTQRLMARQS